MKITQLVPFRILAAATLIPYGLISSPLAATAQVPSVDESSALLWWEADGTGPSPFATFFTLPVDWNASAGDRTAAYLRDSSATEQLLITHTFGAGEQPTYGMEYVVSIDLRYDSTVALHASTLLYRERISGSLFGADVRLADDGSLKWRSSTAASLISSVTGEVYTMPSDTWVTLTLHRVSETQYRIWVTEPNTTHELGLLSVAGGLPDIPMFQIGTGLSADTTSGLYLSSVRIGAAAIPEPGTIALLGAALAGGLLLRKKVGASR